MKVSVITNRGVGIVRSAANRHEKCEIVDCVSSTHFENTANELATKAGEWWDGATGTITMVRAGNGSLKVSVSFPATSYAQPLKSVGIRVKAQGDERAHVLYAVSDGNTAIALNRPYTCDYEIPINVSSDTIEDVGSEPVPGGGGGDTSNLGASLAYDSDTKRLELKNTSKEVISSIDATAFVKDGMLDSVTVSGGNLNFVFNTDAGKETISIPLSDFFDASAYYTKGEVDSTLGNYYTRAEVNDGYYTKTEINNKGYCTEAEVGVNHYTKTEIDGGYIANASYNNATNTLTLSSKDGSKQIDLDLS